MSIWRKTGAVTLIQRFGSALNFNIHHHMLFLDGVYSFDLARPKFHRATRPTPTELAKLLHHISLRVARLLDRQGLLVRAPDHAFLDFEPGEAFDQLVYASIHYRIAIGRNAGRKALTLRSVPAQPEPFASTLLPKPPFSDGTTQVVLDALDFIARLAALVPRPRLNLTRFHGLFAPNCKHRVRIVPKRKPEKVKTDRPLAPMTWMQRRVTDH